MSRKDPRRVLLVPLTPEQRDWLRERAWRGSLSDALRRVVEAELPYLSDQSGHAVPPQVASLSLQLPSGLRHAVFAAALARGARPAIVVLCCLDQARERGKRHTVLQNRL